MTGSKCYVFLHFNRLPKIGRHMGGQSSPKEHSASAPTKSKAPISERRQRAVFAARPGDRSPRRPFSSPPPPEGGVPAQEGGRARPWGRGGARPGRTGTTAGWRQRRGESAWGRPTPLGLVPPAARPRGHRARGRGRATVPWTPCRERGRGRPRGPRTTAGPGTRGRRRGAAPPVMFFCILLTFHVFDSQIGFWCGGPTFTTVTQWKDIWPSETGDIPRLIA